MKFYHLGSLGAFKNVKCFQKFHTQIIYYINTNWNVIIQRHIKIRILYKIYDAIWYRKDISCQERKRKFAERNVCPDGRWMCFRRTSVLWTKGARHDLFVFLIFTPPPLYLYYIWYRTDISCQERKRKFIETNVCPDERECVFGGHLSFEPQGERLDLFVFLMPPPPQISIFVFYYLTTFIR